MAKKIEKNTDFWVADLLKEAEIRQYLSSQGSDIKEIDNALKSASKKKNGNVGKPEFVGVVKDFLIVIEDKADVSDHIKRDQKDLICQNVESITNYAVNGALHYGLHLAKHTDYKKILVFGVSGNEKRHRITPLFINEREEYKELEDVETFISFSEKKHRGILCEEYSQRKNIRGENHRRNFKRCQRTSRGFTQLRKYPR